jgi:hypothetical protein
MKGKPVFIRPFRKTGHGVLFNGEAKRIILGAAGKPTSPQPQGEGRGALAWSHWRDTRSQLIYTWAG